MSRLTKDFSRATHEALAHPERWAVKHRLQPLSEADVRLRLYPSTGRVVKVTEGYWPSRDLFGFKTIVSRDATPGVVTIDSMLTEPLIEAARAFLAGKEVPRR